MRLLDKVILCALLLASWCQASVTFNVTADKLKTAGSQAMPTTGLVVIVVSTGDNQVGEPTESAFVSGDDLVVFFGNLVINQTPGVFADTFQILGFSNGINPGDPVALFWYPTLTVNANAPGTGVPYGRYSPSNGSEQGSSSPWVVPGDGAVVNLEMITTDALTFVGGGPIPSSAGLASLTTPGGNPDPDPDPDPNPNPDPNPDPDPQPTSPVPTALQDSFFFSGTYYFSPAIGGFFLSSIDPPSNFIYTDDFGWLYIVESGTTDGFWFYSFNMDGWFWASSPTGRFAYSVNDQAWLYFESFSGGGSFYQNQTTKQYFYLPQEGAPIPL